MADIIDATENILNKIDEQLDGVLSYLDNFTQIINQKISNNENKAQEILDEEVAKMGQLLTAKLQPIRTNLVNIFSSQLAAVKEKLEKFIAPIKPFVSIDWATGVITPNVPTNPADLPNVIIGIILMLIPAPAVEFYSKFAVQIFPLIKTISDKIQEIKNYKPAIIAPNIEIPELNVNVEPITLGELMAGQTEE